jgi:hypothetical protein
MGNKETPHRWFNGWRSPPRPQEDDPADMGTAFGLDLSLSEPAALPATPAERRPGWVQRLAERRRGTS